jgi:formiminotetrahydrofolate cyclodeaminase
MITTLSVNAFLNETASKSPAPGGGSISALAASLGSALTSMVCRLTIDKKKYADVHREMEEMLKKSERLRDQFTSLIDEDTAAFNSLMAALSLPKDTAEQKDRRTSLIQEETKKATLIPLLVMERCVEAMELVEVISKKGNQNSLSDAGVAALMMNAGCEGAALNVKINLSGLHDEVFVSAAKEKLTLYSDKMNSMAAIIFERMQSLL